MAENKENTADNQKTNDKEKQVNIKPSEPKTSSTDNPGRTPGKAEGEDNESENDTKNK
ncbi:MAG: hypothetical protein ABJA66_10510 [Actinomycetota bacterium]